MHIWSNSLSEFLRRSNEDAVYIHFIGNLVSRAARRLGFDHNSFLRIADIGCGPGSKALGIANRLRDHGLKTHWELVDRDPAWTSILRRRIDSVGNQNQIRFDVHRPISAATWSQASISAPHIAQFIQVAYDDETEDEIFNVAMELVEQKTFVLVSTEHPTSDLHRIRRQFAKLGYDNLPSGRANSLAARFREQGLIVREHFLGRQYLDIGCDFSGVRAKWFWDLVFGNQDPARSENVSETVRCIGYTGFIGSLQSYLLSIPDSLLTVRRPL